jgi:hypothetical protein
MVNGDLFTDEKPSTKKQGFTHDNVDNKSVEWYTPKWIFDELGIEFDLDCCAPAVGVFSNETLRKYGVCPTEYNGGVPWIPAKQHYDIYTDGLVSEWKGNVWCNPPYGKFTPKWLERMSKHQNGIALVFARTDCAWFHDYCMTGDAILFIQRRVKFVDGLGITSGNGAGSGSMLIAWGDENVKALERMRDKGALWKLNN